MRIITGSAKGFKLKAPRGLDTRPTTDRVKESVFAILGDRVVDATVLDLFAGTGNLGLEALSRGAKSAVFLDQSSASVQVIKDNAIHTRLLEKTEIIKNNVLQVLPKWNVSARKFDLIFCDPPYNRGLAEAVLKIIDSSPLLSENGLVVVEHSRHESLPAEWKQLIVKRVERYGETVVSFLQIHKA